MNSKDEEIAKIVEERFHRMVIEVYEKLTQSIKRKEESAQRMKIFLDVPDVAVMKTELILSRFILEQGKKELRLNRKTRKRVQEYLELKGWLKEVKH